MIQELRHFLQQFQLDFPKLFIAFAVCLIVFIFSARELACWFFKIQGIRKDQKRLTEKIDGLEQLIKNLVDTNKQANELTQNISEIQKKKTTLQFPIQNGLSQVIKASASSSVEPSKTLPTEEWMNRPLT